MYYSKLAKFPSSPVNKTIWPWNEVDTHPPTYMPEGFQWPKISIVTPSYNQGQFLEETIRSVLLQGYPNLEYIIIDGGSTDNSIEIIKKYEPWLAYWVSEPDRGQAHAINKGLEQCTGEIFNWLNSDDYLEPNALCNIALNFGDAHALAGSVRNVYHGSKRDEVIQNSELVFWKWLTGNHPDRVYHQPGVWLRPDLIAACGGIDESLHFYFDGDLMYNYIFFYPKINYINNVLVNFRLHADSKTVKSTLGRDYFLDDHVEILRKLMIRKEFHEYHSIIKHKLRKLEWHSFVNKTRFSSDISIWKKRWYILRLIWSDPVMRLSRFTLGSIWQC